jgi:hypothetical protein
MSYKRNLTFNLRLRGLSEPEIAKILDEVRAHEAATSNPIDPLLRQKGPGSTSSGAFSATRGSIIFSSLRKDGKEA